MSVQIRNLTPHEVRILDPRCCEFNPRTRSYSLIGELVVLMTIAPEDGNVPRCSTHEVECDPICGIPTLEIAFGQVENLPDQSEGQWLIVSAIVANAARANGRTDCLVPAHMVRDASGNIVGCLALARG